MAEAAAHAAAIAQAIKASGVLVRVDPGNFTRILHMQDETLVVIAEEGTFDAAARRLHITPSAVSQRIRALERAAGREVVDDVVPPLGELVQDHVLGVERELLAPVVDLLDVALGAGRADHVLRLGDPALEPGEALAAHPLGQDGDAAAAEQPRDRDAAAAVVPGRGPDRAVACRVERALDEAGRGRGGRVEVRPDGGARHDLAEGRSGSVGVDHETRRGGRLGTRICGGPRAAREGECDERDDDPPIKP